MAVNMVPMKSVVVIRDGKRVTPTIGKSFPFTAEERNAILEVDSTALRKPTDETAGTDADAAAAARTAEASQSKARGGKKAATASQADSEVEDTDPPEGEGGGPGAGTDDDL